MPPQRYKQNKDSRRRGNRSVFTSVSAPLSEYEQTLANNPGPGKDDSWVVDFLRNAPIPGLGPLLQSPVGEALIGKAERPIKNILEEGEDAPVIGPALGAVGRGFDILSRGNYAAANVARELLPEEANQDQGFLEQLKSLWQTGAAIPSMALPDFIAESLGIRREGVTPGDLGRAAWEGLSGKEKAIFSQVLGEQGVENNFLQGAGGLGLDIALDPTTYLGTGVVKGPTKADDILRQVDSLTPGPRPSPSPIPSEIPVGIRTRTNPFPGHVPPAESGPTSFLGNFGPNLPEGNFPRPSPAQRQVVGEFSPYPRQTPERIFEPQGPLGRVSPVEEVGSSGFSVQQELPFGQIVPDPIQLDEGITNQLNFFDRRTRRGKEALEGVDWPKIDKRRIKSGEPDPRASLASDQDFIEQSLDEALRLGAGSTPMGQLALQFPEKAEEIKWLQLFDPDMPQHVKKSWSPSKGVELRVDPPEPWEIESLIEMPAKAASDDWEVARQLYLPDGPVDIPVSGLVSNGIEGLIKAPYEVPGIKGESFNSLPWHRELTNLSNEGARLAEPDIFDLGDLNKPWGKPGSGKGGSKGPRFNPGKLPGAGSPASQAEGYVALRFAGADIVRSAAAYKVGRSVFRPFFYGNGIARTLGKAFNMGAHLPDGLDQMHRVAENTNMAYFDRNMRAVTNHLGKLPSEERRQIGRALADGTNLSEFKPSVLADEFQSAEDYRQLAKGIFDEAWIAEDLSGVAKGPYVDNYFKRQILNEGKLTKEDLKYAKAKNSDGTYRHSVQDLIDRGIEVELDVNKVLVDRMAESARKITKADFQWQAVARYGIPADKITPEMAKKLDLVPVDTIITGKNFKGNIYMPRHINEAMKWQIKFVDSDEISNKAMNLLDKVIGEWKYLALATPGRHVRDTIGDVIMNAQAGVWNPNSYRKASKILGMSTPGRNKVAQIEESFVMSKVLGQEILPDVGHVTIAGQKIPVEKAWELYVQSGAKAGQLSTEISRLAALPKGKGEVLGGAANLPGRAYAATKRNIGRFSDTREDWSRLAHVVDYLDRKAVKGREVFGPGGDLTSYGKQLAEEAGRSVRKWNIDYGNLTPFERNVVRRVIPFYCVPVSHEIWTRSGWKSYNQLTVGEEVMTFNHQTQEMKYEPLLEVAVFEFDGQLGKIERRTGKIQFTMNHRWPCVTESGYGYMKEAHQLDRDLIPRQGEFTGTESILEPRLAAILGWIVTDGHCRWKGNHFEAVIYQHPKKFLEEVCKLTGALPRPPHPDTGVVAVPISLEDRKEITRYFSERWDLKHIVPQLSREAADAMWTAMFQAEGSMSGPDRKSLQFSQEDPHVLEAFQMLTYMTGRNGWIASSRGMYINHHKTLGFKEDKGKRDRYKGLVWCPRTPSGTWFVRNGGAVMPTGNTFMRHNIPRQLELLFTKPGFMSLYPKGNNLMQGVFGTESGDDTLLPNWIRESAPFRVQLEKQEQKGALGWLLKQFGAEPGQQVLADPHSFTTPIGDFSALNAIFNRDDPLKAVSQEIGSRLTPLIKVPAEIMTGNKVFNGAPIKGDYLGYLMEQLPQGRVAHNLFEGGPSAREGFARTVTGIPIRGITDRMMNNEAYRREIEASKLFQESLSRNLPAQYRIPRTGNSEQDQRAVQKEREIYRNLMRAQGDR